MLAISMIIALLSAVGAVVLIWAPLQESIGRSTERARTQLTSQLDEMFVFLPAEHLTSVKVGAAALFGVIAFVLSYNTAAPGPFVAAGLGGVLGFFSPTLLVAWLKRRRRKRFAEQLVDGLTLLSNGMRAGFTMQQAIEMLVEESQPPLSQEFDLVLREHRLGVDVDKALANCARRTRDADLALATTAVSVTRQLGGNIAEIFERIVTMIRARKMLEGKVDALTAQGRMQAVVVAAMPYLFGLFTMKVNPALMKLMWTTLPGILCLALVVILDTVGYLWVVKITNVKY